MDSNQSQNFQSSSILEQHLASANNQFGAEFKFERTPSVNAKNQETQMTPESWRKTDEPNDGIIYPEAPRLCYRHQITFNPVPTMNKQSNKKGFFEDEDEHLSQLLFNQEVQ